MAQRVVSYDKGYQSWTEGMIVDGQKCVVLDEQQRVVSYDGYRSLAAGAILDTYGCVVLWAGQRVVSYHDGYRTCAAGAVLSGKDCLIISRGERIVSFEDGYASITVGQRLNDTTCVRLFAGQRVVSHDDGYQSCRKGSIVDGTHCIILGRGQRVVSHHDGYQSLAPGSIVDHTNCVILGDGDRVVSWESGFTALEPGSIVDGVHCVILRRGQRVVSWDDGYKTCKAYSVIDDVNCRILDQGQRIVSADDGFLTCKQGVRFNPTDWSNCVILSDGDRVVSRHDGYRTCAPGQTISSNQCFILYAGQRVASWQDGYQSCVVGETADESNCVVMRRDEVVVSASSGYAELTPGDRVNGKSCIKLQLDTFDRSRFETRPKMAFDLPAGQTLWAPVPVPDGDLSEMTVVVMVATKTPGRLFTCGRPGGESDLELSITVMSTGDVVVAQRIAAGSQSTQTIAARAVAGRDLLDGCRHSIVFRGSGASREIFIDGDKMVCATTGNLPDGADDGDGSDVDLLASLGGSDPTYGGPFSGRLFGAGLWQAALTDSEIRRAAFGFLNGLDLDLIAFWTFDGTLNDVSSNGCGLLGLPRQFQPTPQCYWAATPMDPEQPGSIAGTAPRFTLYHVDGVANPYVDPTTMIDSDHAFNVNGAGVLFGALTGRGTQITADDRVIVTLTRPDGVRYEAPVALENVIVDVRAGGVRAFILNAPMPGTWKLHIRAPADVGYTFQVQAFPVGSGAFVVQSRRLALDSLLLGFDDINRDRGRSVTDGGGWRWWGERIGVVALVGVIAVLALGTGATAPIILAMLVTAADAASNDRARQHVQQMNRTDNISACAQTADYIAISTERKRLLFIDAANKAPSGQEDQDSDRAYRARMPHIERILKTDAGQKFEGKFLADAEVSPAAVLAALGDPRVVYVSATGHGQPDRLYGRKVPNSNDVLQVVLDTSISGSLVKDKIFHFLACHIGAPSLKNDPNSAGLARKLYQLGAKAAFGYVERYDIGQPEILLQCTCTADAEIERVLISGGTVGEALQAAKDKYQSLLYGLPGQSLKDRLSRNMKMLTVWGDRDARL